MHFGKVIFGCEEQAGAGLNRTADPTASRGGSNGELQGDQGFSGAAVAIEQRDVARRYQVFDMPRARRDRLREAALQELLGSKARITD